MTPLSECHRCGGEKIRSACSKKQAASNTTYHNRYPALKKQKTTMSHQSPLSHATTAMVLSRGRITGKATSLVASFLRPKCAHKDCHKFADPDDLGLVCYDCSLDRCRNLDCPFKGQQWTDRDGISHPWCRLCCCKCQFPGFTEEQHHLTRVTAPCGRCLVCMTCGLGCNCPDAPELDDDGNYDDDYDRRYAPAF